MKHNLNCHCGAVQLEVLTDLEIIKQDLNHAFVHILLTLILLNIII